MTNKRRPLQTKWEEVKLMNAMKFIAQVDDNENGDKLIENIIDQYTTPRYYEQIDLEANYRGEEDEECP